ncbi:MAG: Nif3-like dinuclear metal center hexameric protein [Chromatiaceae bacterium]|nr:MAG: Nif3-like dinuclear metal center hexameric protein [Chromatiaceae bacterium]
MTAAATTAIELAHHCDALLAVADFTDYCPNGLQVEGNRPIRLLVTGVTASLDLIAAAGSAGADALLVHHGIFWKGDEPCLIGPKGRRVRALITEGMSLLAYHLPLDAHPELGNNRCLAERLGISEARPLADTGAKTSIPIWIGRLPTPCAGSAVATAVAAALGRTPLHIAAHARPVQRIAWCTGAAQGYIEAAAAAGADLYLSGEVSESTVHLARELSIDYLGAGHHATERYGIQALGAMLATQFGLTHRFIDIDNPA